MDKKMMGVVILVISILCLVGGYLILDNAADNEAVHDFKQEYEPGYEGSDEEKEDEESIELTYLMGAACCGIFVILFIIGAIFMVSDENKPVPMGPPQAIYQQHMPPQQYQQYPPPQQYQQPSPNPQVPPQQAFPCAMCGAQVPYGWTNCPQCGAQIQR